MMSSKQDIRKQISEAETRRTLLLASAGTVRSRKPVEANNKMIAAERESKLIAELHGKLGVMS